MDGVEHSGLYARRPLHDEPPERLATLPKTLVIFGSKDWVKTPSAERAARELPNFSLHVEPDDFHHLYIDHPELFHRLAAGFLS